MKTRVAAGVTGILVIVSAFLLFFFFHVPVKQNLYRLLFTALYEGAIVSGAELIARSRKKMPRVRRIFFAAGNITLIVLGVFLLYGVPLLLTHHSVGQALPFLSKLSPASALLTTLLTLDISLFVAFNLVVFGLANGNSVKQVVVPIIVLFFAETLIVFFVNTPHPHLSDFIRLAYLVVSVALWIVLFFSIFGVVNAKKKTKRNGLIAASAFLCAELAYEFVSWKSLITGLPVPQIHDVVLALIGGNLFAGFLSYSLTKRKPLVRTLRYQIPLLTGIVILATAISFGTDLKQFLFYAIAYSLGVASAVVSTCVLLDERRVKIRRKLALLSVPGGLAVLEAVYLVQGIEWLKFQLISLTTIGVFALAIVLGVVYLLLVTRKPKPQEKKRTAKKPTKAERIDPPFEAYKGAAKFVFVSYSHRDMADVFSICRKLFDDGYRIWYDEGIEPGREWPETVGKAIENCEQFLVFTSPSAVQSRNVRNEVNYAVSRHKDIIVVTLKKTKLSYGLELQIGTVQAINQFEMDQKEFLKRMHAILRK